MIASLTGELRRVDEDRVHLRCGPILYELLVPAADMTELQASLGEELTFHTIFYLAGDPTRGGLDPTLIGFLRPDDKKFFELFTTVKGIGPKRALRALAVSVGQIAGAIEGKDTRFLVQLPEIGKRTAEQIVAELAGKLKTFAAAGLMEGKPGAPTVRRRDTIEEDAIAGLMALGERRPDAENLLERAKQSNPNLKTADQLLREMLRMRTVRA
jgi:Holliday junction DNA helicase RuvA